MPQQRDGCSSRRTGRQRGHVPAASAGRRARGQRAGPRPRTRTLPPGAPPPRGLQPPSLETPLLPSPSRSSAASDQGEPVTARLNDGVRPGALVAEGRAGGDPPLIRQTERLLRAGPSPKCRGSGAYDTQPRLGVRRGQDAGLRALPPRPGAGGRRGAVGAGPRALGAGRVPGPVAEAFPGVSLGRRWPRTPVRPPGAHVPSSGARTPGRPCDQQGGLALRARPARPEHTHVTLVRNLEAHVVTMDGAPAHGRAVAASVTPCALSSHAAS